MANLGNLYQRFEQLHHAIDRYAIPLVALAKPELGAALLAADAAGHALFDVAEKALEAERHQSEEVRQTLLTEWMESEQAQETDVAPAVQSAPSNEAEPIVGPTP